MPISDCFFLATDPVRQTVESVSSDVPPFQLPDSETEELPTFPFIVSNSHNRCLFFLMC